MKIKAGIMLMCLVVLVSVAPQTAMAAEGASSTWMEGLEQGDTLPDQFLFGGEPPTLEEVKESFLRHYGADPETWPEEFRKIHNIQTKWIQRALSSSRYRGQFSGSVLERMKTQLDDPVTYWSRCLYEGWGYEEWFSADHLTLGEVPRALLDRFMTELFPLTWRDIRSATRVQEYMLDLPDSKFKPYNNYDQSVASRRRKDVLAYNESIEKTAEFYKKQNDFMMLALMPERIDTNWVGDAGFERSLGRQKKKLASIVDSFMNGRDMRFREAFYKQVPSLAWSWNEEIWSENHVILNGKPSAITDANDALGNSTRIEHPFSSPKVTITERRVVSGPAVLLQWSAAPEFSPAYDRGAVISRTGPRYTITLKKYGDTQSYALTLYLNNISGFGHEVAISPADGAEYTPQISSEILDSLCDAFFAAADAVYGPPGSVAAGNNTGKPLAHAQNSLEIKPQAGTTLQVLSESPPSLDFIVSVSDGREPVAHAEVILRKPEIGVLSSPNATGGDERSLYLETDPLGNARVTYTPPALGELKMLGGCQWMLEIRATENAFGGDARLPVTIRRPAELDIRVAHQVLPAEPGYENHIRFRFDSIQGGRGGNTERFRVVMEALSGDGRLSLSADEGPNLSDGNSLVFEANPAKEYNVSYTWEGGATTGGPVDETISIRIPELGLEGAAGFSVGVSPEIGTLPGDTETVPGHPGLFVPITMYVKDQYHPELEMDAFLRAFDLDPVIEIEQTDFKPLDGGDDRTRAIIRNILARVRGASLPRKAVSLEPGAWSLVKDTSSNWVLAGDRTSGGNPLNLGLPGVIPWEYGDYTFRIRLDLEKPDETERSALTKTMTTMLRVRPLNQSEAEDGRTSLVLPMAMTYSAMFPGEEARAFLGKLRTLLEKGQYDRAAVALGERFARKFTPPGSDPLQPAETTRRMTQLVAEARLVSENQLTAGMLNNCIAGAKPVFLALVAGVYADEFFEEGFRLSSLMDPSIREKDPLSLQFLQLIQGFLEGYGEYGLAVFSTDNLESIEVFSENGDLLTPLPNQVFGCGDDCELIYRDEHSVVVPFRLGEQMLVNLESSGKPVEAIKILPNGINVKKYCEGKTNETVTVHGDVVRP